MTKSCIKFVIYNYISIFKQINVEILTFYKILIIVCAINFEIVFRQNNNDGELSISSIFAKLNLERNPITEKNIFLPVLCLKYLEI